MLLRRVCVLDIPRGRLARSNRFCRIQDRRACHRRRTAAGMALFALSWKSCQPTAGFDAQEYFRMQRLSVPYRTQAIRYIGVGLQFRKLGKRGNRVLSAGGSSVASRIFSGTKQYWSR